MALFAILSDDKASIREVRDFPINTVFKPGYAFPAVIDPQPVFDPTLSYLVQSVGMPLGGVVTISWVITDIPQLTKDNTAKIKNLKDLFDSGDVLDAKRIAGTATAQDLRDLGVIAWQIVRKNKQAVLDTYRP